MIDIQFIINAFGIVILSVLTFVKVADHNKLKQDSYYLFMLLSSCISLLFQEYMIFASYGVSDIINQYLAFDIEIFFAYISLMFFCLYILANNVNSLITNCFKVIIVCLTITLYIFMVINPNQNFYVLQNYHVLFNKFYRIVLFIIVFELLICLIFAFYNKEKYKIFYCLAILIILIDIVICMYYQMFDYLLAITSVAPLFIYNKTRIDLAEKLANTEVELSKTQVELMLSQIQPHFLYNSLNAIAQVVKKNPDIAERKINDFAFYLRGNIDAIGNKEMIPFYQELKHINYYLSLEELRFSNKIKVIYDINVSDFMIPTLSVEPLVENAIKHGIGKKPQGGSVRISTREEKNNFLIEIEDDGVGFNINKDYGEQHVGLKNVKNRLRLLNVGTMSVDSTINKGTKITLFIKKDED